MVKRKGLLMALIIAVLVLCSLTALADEARDITRECKITTRINSKEIRRLTDRNYKSCFNSGTGEKAAINIDLPKGENAGGLYIKWFNQSVAIRVQVKKDGGYETILTSDTPYLCDYIEFPEGISSFRFLPDEKVRGRMYLAEIYVYSRGDIPQDVQRWEPSWPKADLLVISTHPDDELIFFGGTIPYYTKEMGMAVQVAYVVPATPERRLELLDGLWYCGVRNYPAIGKFADRFSNKMADVQKAWGKARLEKFIVNLYREFQPEVVIAQDIKGEYGHGAHKAVSDAAQKAIKLAADPTYEKGSVGDLGTWEIKKLYLHLYKENPIQLNWRLPLDSFEGQTAFDIAQAAFLFHVSQQKGKYFVEDFGPYDNSQFGLFYTTVGPDVEKDDFFENVF